MTTKQLLQQAWVLLSKPSITMLVKVLVHKTKPNVFGCPDYNFKVIEEHPFPYEIASPEVNYLKGLSDCKFANIEDYEEQIWELTSPKKD